MIENSKKILATGGAGYIGSHTLIALDKAGYDLSSMTIFVTLQKSL